MKPPKTVVLEHNQKLEQIVKGLNDTIGELRVSITYLLFDLEATKREKQELQQMLRSQD